MKDKKTHLGSEEGSSRPMRSSDRLITSSGFEMLKLTTMFLSGPPIPFNEWTYYSANLY